MADAALEANISSSKDVDRADASLPAQRSDAKTLPADRLEATVDRKSNKCRSTQHKKGKRTAKKHTLNKTEDSSEDTSTCSSSDSEAMTYSTNGSSSESDTEATRRRQRKAKLAKQATKVNRRSKRRQRSARNDSDSDASDSSDDNLPVKRSRKKRSRRVKVPASAGESDTESAPEVALAALDNIDEMKIQLEALKIRLEAAETHKAKPATAQRRRGRKSEKPKAKKASSYKRVDQLWDSTIHNFKLKETTKEDDSEFAEYAFTVRRRFDFEGQYLFTMVDIKSTELKKSLAEVMKDCKSVSLDAEEPTIDPNLLFLYVEQLRKYYKKTLKAAAQKERKKKLVKRLQTQRALCKLLVDYIDEDYAETKRTLYPLLEAGNISFELAWALFKPGEMVITSTYGIWDEPRCFKVDYANKQRHPVRGEYYSLEGKYMEYDGKSFGLGDFEIDIESFKGVRKISSLPAYPLRYHRNETAVRKQIIERGKQFVQCEGMNYRFHKGLAFMKKKKQVLKININGRVMIDPATFRRINANYPVSVLKAKDGDDLFSDYSDDCSCCDSNSEDDETVGHGESLEQRASDNDEPRVKYEFVQGDDGSYVKVAVEVDDDGNRIRPQKIEQLDKVVKQTFTEDELLMTSSVVLGFAFSEKLWLEFTLSGVKDIEYNEGAFDSLVLPQNQKSIVKALVESHKFHAAKTIDDVVQGKGRSLVAVLHGPPGTGKTLTAESIAELLKCPLYMVSAGELGTDPARLETELQRILDVAHCWGAVLLLDEADVFLEKRETHDIHRNALVSIFLRTLEYFAGILFLTTNRVETFDEAFQSRIHVALKYSALTAKAKCLVWKMFFDLCKKQDGCPVADLSDNDFDMLARHDLNGRQIKNIVRTAQALALNEKATLGLAHVKRVLGVAEDFQRDLRGGTGYDDAMRSYT